MRAILLLFWLSAVAALAQQAQAPVSVDGQQAQPAATDQAVEARLLLLAEELRCLVCQNETLAASHAELAIDLKNQIREQIRSGRSDREIIDYLVARYGDFVLYRPPLKASTVALWGGPFVLLLFGLAVMVRQLKARGRALQSAAAPSEAELARARQLLTGGEPRA
jgi:cytochrome c-type biogenesis protein CcmH